jgi:transcriptional regulator with GAF, ATPase, and Fis domain
MGISVYDAASLEPPKAGAIDAPSVARVLSEIAEIASETLELQDVFGRVATSVQRVIPFDHMGVLRILEGGWAVKHAATFECTEPDAECSEPFPLTAWSPRLRPRPGSIPRIDDATVELDPSFPGDTDILEKGVRSTMWEPFRTGESFHGGVWICSRQPQAFTPEHQQVLRPIAALLGSAVQHWRIWDTERRRRERLDRVESLLATLAESLDVRQVFQRLSTEMQPILAHDLMVLTELDVRARTIRITASAGPHGLDVPTEAVALTDNELEKRIDFEIVHDIPAEIAPTTDRQRLVISSGMRSWLRVPVFLTGEIQGGLSFFHRDPSRFAKDDAEVARRLADRIALTLSLRQLAEEARIAAESRDRAERLQAAVETLTREMAARGRGRIVGGSRSWKAAVQQVGRVAPSDTTALITGESGTGKEVIANLIHRGSPRAGKPFVAINCAALPEQLLESELFGHERGAFTGAISTKIGRIEQAAGGTLFLDEIAEMSPLVQAKFLRVLQEREFQRLGGTRTIAADVRVIAATNRDLSAAIAKQQFREDLYYRLNVFAIHLPPLRERPEDVLLLADAFVEDLGKTMTRPAAGISRDAREWLLAYPWPGNVRELRNAIERAILLCDGGLITREHLPVALVRAEPAHGNGNGNGAEAATIPAGPMNLDAVERDYILKALSQTKGNKSKAARMLGLSRAQLYWRLEKYGVD